MNVQTLQVNRAIQVKALMSVVRSSGIRIYLASTDRFDSVPGRRFAALLPFALRSITVFTSASADGKGIEVCGFMSRLTFILRYQITKGRNRLPQAPLIITS